MAYISRDPFARSETHRKTVEVVSQACGWCGGVRKTKAGMFHLYQYRTESDGGRIDEHRGLFCSRSCHNSYHA